MKFRDYLIQAQAEVLSNREQIVLCHLYGCCDQARETLSALGKRFNVSPTRITQLRDRALFKIRERGKSDMQSACGYLRRYLWDSILPEQPGELDRLQAFANAHLSWLPTASALPLLVQLLDPGRTPRRSLRQLKLAQKEQTLNVLCATRIKVLDDRKRGSFGTWHQADQGLVVLDPDTDYLHISALSHQKRLVINPMVVPLKSSL